jgi:3-phenylpropionate/trans-cinnamate dioxygenase ferredoxin reductase subunit
MIGQDEAHPYERPPLSKALLKKTVSVESIEVRQRSWYSENTIELIRSCSATSIDLRERCVHVDRGSPISFDKVLIATGASPRRLAGVEGHRVFYLRNMTDALSMSAHLFAGSRIAIVGGGLIGAEVAATARESGADVVVIEPQSVLMEKTAGVQVGQLYSTMHRQNGVKLMLGDALAQVRADRDSVEIVTKAGVKLEADVLLICVGILPNDEIARSANVNVQDGIVVDQFFNASHPAVYAAGDVARAFYPKFSEFIRTESHDSAIKQGAGAAANMLGRDAPNHDVPWGWSDQYGQNLQFAGCRSIADHSIVRGDIESGSFIVLHTRQGRVCAALSFNRGREMIIARRMIAVAALVNEASVAEDGNSLQKGFSVDAKPVAQEAKGNVSIPRERQA